jgi:ATP-dependent Lon protease
MIPNVIDSSGSSQITFLSELDEKTKRVFGDISIDKRRLPITKLDKRGIPAYVAEWVIDMIAPSKGPLTDEQINKIRDWANRYIPGPDEAKVIQNRLLNGETVKALTSVEVDIKLTRRHQDRAAQMKLLQITDAMIADGLVEKYPDLLKQGMWGVVELVSSPEGVSRYMTSNASNSRSKIIQRGAT